MIVNHSDIVICPLLFSITMVKWFSIPMGIVLNSVTIPAAGSLILGPESINYYALAKKWMGNACKSHHDPGIRWYVGSSM